MRMRGWVGAVVAMAALPGMAPGDPRPVTTSFGDVPDVRLNPPAGRGGQRAALARAYDEGYDDGYADGYGDGVEYAEDAVTYRGRWVRGPAAGREGAAHGGGYGGPPPGYPGALRMETWRSDGGYVPGGAPGTQVFGLPGGGTVVVVQSAPVVTRTVTYREVRTVAPKTTWVPKRKWAAKKWTPKRTWRRPGK